MTPNHGDDARPSHPDQEGPAPGGAEPAVFSRRALLTGAGRVATVGTMLSAGTSLVGQGTAEAAGGGAVADGPREGTTLEFVARVEQDGNALNGAGYLTFVDGLDPSALFSDPNNRSEATARFTATASAVLTGRSVLDNVFAIDAQGQLTIYFQDPPGAAFADPGSFSAGQAVAVYDVTLQDILTVIAPNTGIPTVSGDLEQRQAAQFRIGDRRYRFGRPKLRMRLEATGGGVRTDAGAPRATLTLAGNAVVVG